MSNRNTQAPPGWGEDALTAFLEDCHGNHFATFWNKPLEVSDLIAIDAIFVRLTADLTDPKPLLPMTFLMRAFSAFRASVGAAMAGQTFETYALLRLCLEHGAYGVFIGDNVALWERWMRRHDEGDISKRKVRDAFTYAKIRRGIRDVLPENAKAFEELYERCIDFGAHPNQMGFSTNSRIDRTDGKMRLDTVLVQGEGLPMDLALKTAAQVGLWVLLAMKLFYAERYDEIAINNDLEAIRERY
ncbi:hypothetical protein [Aliihoeflea sp. 40Bstr573]|uniref:hypothetical protein n=1 Tax=Aliihoeflea sp. 40Bstr573 TaxID=2696467 RepID=UPI002095CB09|nr:hypothetical protein [Aliihoeflea sp. 40Bstr573]MCO6387947.1 hypothetical protein [Aliihoeflea sp. 40Bstr573]